MSTLKFAVFADFHYKKGMYAPTPDDLAAILARANTSGAAFIIHAGDFSNDYIRSSELTRLYLENEYHLPAYGVYGNHELEAADNSMAAVTPLLCNRDVVWGTADGKIGDGSIAYYYFDVDGFRIIGTDSNYSYNEAAAEWQHNTTCSYGAPRGNMYENSLGPIQLRWLEDVLADAAKKGLHCIVFSHASYCETWGHSPDTKAVNALFEQANAARPGTVFMAINGHYHTDHMAVIDHIAYFDVNTAINGYWMGTKEPHYAAGQTFDYTDYDADGNRLATWKRDLSELWMAKNTWFFTKPTSAIVTVSSDGHIEIEGCETEWVYGITPPTSDSGVVPRITSHKIDLTK